jgi:predicted MFS family arabinose efflux permease
MISSSALITGVPDAQDRGAFMSINSSVQQISGGIAAYVAGLIVVQTPDGQLSRYPTLGLVVIGSMVASTAMMYWVDRYVNRKYARAATQNNENINLVPG